MDQKDRNGWNSNRNTTEIMKGKKLIVTLK